MKRKSVKVMKVYPNLRLVTVGIGQVIQDTVEVGKAHVNVIGLSSKRHGIVYRLLRARILKF